MTDKLVITPESLRPPEPMSAEDFKLPAEKNPEFLRNYGLAMALYATAEHALTLMIRFKANLRESKSEEFIKKIFENKTFGRKTELAKTLPISDELKAALGPAVEDRNMLAHGVTSEQEKKLGLMHKGKFHDLSNDELEQIIKRARSFGALVMRDLTQTINKQVASE